MTDVNSASGETPIEAVDPNAEAAERADVIQGARAERSDLSREVEAPAEPEGNEAALLQAQAGLFQVNDRLQNNESFTLDQFNEAMRSIIAGLPVGMDATEMRALFQGFQIAGLERWDQSNIRENLLNYFEQNRFGQERFDALRSRFNAVQVEREERFSRSMELNPEIARMLSLDPRINPRMVVDRVRARLADRSYERYAEYQRGNETVKQEIEFDVLISELTEEIYNNRYQAWLAEAQAAGARIAANQQAAVDEEFLEELGADGESELSEGFGNVLGSLSGILGTPAGENSRQFPRIDRDPFLRNYFMVEGSADASGRNIAESRREWYRAILSGEMPNPDEVKNQISGILRQRLRGVSLDSIEHDFSAIEVPDVDEVDRNNPEAMREAREILEFMSAKMQTVGLGWAETEWESRYESYVLETGVASLNFDEWLARESREGRGPNPMMSLWRNFLSLWRSIFDEFLGEDGDETDDRRLFSQYEQRLEDLDQEPPPPGADGTVNDVDRLSPGLSGLSSGATTSRLRHRLADPENVQIPEELTFELDGDRRLRGFVSQLLDSDIDWGDYELSQRDLDNLARGYGDTLSSTVFRIPTSMGPGIPIQSFFKQNALGQFQVLRANDGDRTEYATFENPREFFEWLDNQYAEWPEDRDEGLADDILSGDSIDSGVNSLGAGYSETPELAGNDRNRRFLRKCASNNLQIPNALLYQAGNNIQVKDFVHLLVHEDIDPLWQGYQMSQLDLNNLARGYGDILDSQGGSLMGGFGLFEDSFSNADGKLRVDMAVDGQNTYQNMDFDNVAAFFQYLDRQYAHRYSTPETPTEEEPASSDAEPENTTTS